MLRFVVKSFAQYTSCKNDGDTIIQNITPTTKKTCCKFVNKDLLLIYYHFQNYYVNKIVIRKYKSSCYIFIQLGQLINHIIINIMKFIKNN